MEDQAASASSLTLTSRGNKIPRLLLYMVEGEKMTTISAATREVLAKLGAKKAVAELHPELHAEFRAAWPTMDEDEASLWVERLLDLPRAESDSRAPGLRECREKGWGDDLVAVHYRQVEVLKDIPAEDRSAVISSAHLMQNLVGGILSGCLWSAAQQYRRVGVEAMKRQDRLSNARAMGWAVDEGGYRIDLPA